MSDVPDTSIRCHWWKVSVTEVPCTWVNEIWVVNLDGRPLGGSIMGPGVISETGCPRGVRDRERGVGHQLIRIEQPRGEGQPVSSTRREKRELNIHYDEDNKVHKTTQHRTHKTGQCGLRLKKRPVLRGSLTDRTILI